MKIKIVTGKKKGYLTLTLPAETQDNQDRVVYGTNREIGEIDHYQFQSMGFTIWMSRFVVLKDIKLLQKIHRSKPLALTFVLSGNLPYTLKGFGKGVALQDYYNMVRHLRKLDVTYTLKKGEEYILLGIEYDPNFLLHTGKPPAELDRLIRHGKPGRVNAIAETDFRMESRERNIVTELRKQLEDKSMTRSMILDANVLMLAHFASERASSKQQAIPQYIREIHEDIINTHGAGPNAAEYARKYHMNKTKQRNEFRDAFGATIAEFRHEVRMAVAMQLREEKERGKAIAEHIGYSSPSNFSTAYRNFMEKKSLRRK